MPQQDKSKVSARDIANELKGFDKEFDKADRADDFEGFTPLDEGDYLLGVQDFDWFRAKESENLGVKIKFVAVEEKNSGIIFHNFMITENNLPYLKRDLELMGVKLKTLSDLQSIDFMQLATKAHLGQREYTKPGESTPRV